MGIGYWVLGIGYWVLGIGGWESDTPRVFFRQSGGLPGEAEATLVNWVYRSTMLTTLWAASVTTGRPTSCDQRIAPP